MIALYRGVSFISRAIQFVSWSDYSHASWVSDDDQPTREIEAWHVGGVTCNAGVGAIHTPGTVVELYRVRDITPEQDRAVEAFMMAQVGKKYDFAGITKFLTRRSASCPDQGGWFCSELVMHAHLEAAALLLARVPAWKVAPGLLSYSPLLEYAKTIVTEAPVQLESA